MSINFAENDGKITLILENEEFHEFKKILQKWNFNDPEALLKFALNLLSEEEWAINRTLSLKNLIIYLMSELLRWEKEVSNHSEDWKFAIQRAQLRILRILDYTPSLKSFAEKAVKDCYKEAVYEAMKEADLNESVFPEQCAFELENILKYFQ